MKVYLIRHAQAEHNVTGNTGMFDPPITLLGKQQCDDKRENYKDVHLVLASTSTRVLESASLLFDQPIYATDLLLEYNTGASCNCRYDLNHQKNKFPNVNFDTYLVPPLSKETTWQDGELRAKKVIELIKTIDTPVLAVVSHANFIRNIMTLLKSYNPTELENCGCYTITL